MEAGKPDETRKVGEEVVGPIELPRPEGAGWFQLVSSMLLLVIVKVAAEESVEVIIQPLHWSGEVAGSLSNGVGVLVCVTMAVGLVWWRSRSHFRFKITKGRMKTTALELRRFEFWTGATIAERFIPVGACILPGFIFVWLAFTSGSKSGHIFGATLVIFWVFFALKLLPSLWRPLLVVDEKGAHVGNRFFDWTSVEQIEVEQTLNLDGAFHAVRLSFFNAGCKRLARVSLPKNQCGRLEEEELLAFIAARLGRRYEHLAQPDINWL